MARELRLITKDIPNPTLDKRRKHGLECIPVFRKGTTFTFEDFRHGLYPVVEYEIDGHYSGQAVRYALASALINNSRVIQPRTFKQGIQLQTPFVCPATHGLRVLEELIRLKKVSLTTALRLAKKLEETDD